jgi:Pex2/Pex12-like protein
MSVRYTRDSSSAGKYSLLFPDAGQAEIVRASLKDNYYKDIVQTRVSALATALFGTKWSHAWQNELALLSDVVFLGTTTLCGRQTLGEEYSDIFQLTDQHRLPSSRQQTLLVFAAIGLPYMLDKVLCTHLTACANTAVVCTATVARSAIVLFSVAYSVQDSHCAPLAGSLASSLPVLHCTAVFSMGPGSRDGRMHLCPHTLRPHPFRFPDRCVVRWGSGPESKRGAGSRHHHTWFSPRLVGEETVVGWRRCFGPCGGGWWGVMALHR